MRDPYAARRDMTKVATIAIAALAVIAAVLVLFAMLRPTSSAGERAREQALERQMDAAEASTAQKQQAIDQTRSRDFQ